MALKNGNTSVFKDSSSEVSVLFGGIPVLKLETTLTISYDIILPSGHSVRALPVNFNVIVLILAAFETSNRSFPLTRALLEDESLVVPSGSKPLRKTVGSANVI